MNEETIKDFNDRLHEELYCMFVAEANSATYLVQSLEFCEENIDQLVSTIINEYRMLYEYRSICEMTQAQIDGWISLANSFSNTPHWVINKLKPLDFVEDEE